MNLAEIIKFKFPQADLTRRVVIQDDGQGPYIAKWDDTLGSKPTQADLDLWVVELAPVKQVLDACAARRAAYPAIGDQLDAVLKHFEVKEAEGEVLTPELKAVKDQWAAVRTEFPI